MLWFVRDLFGLAPIHLAYRCATHVEMGWMQFKDWERHVMSLHYPNERAADIACDYRNSEPRSDGTLRLGSTVRHT